MPMPAQNLIIITATYSYLVSLQHAQYVTWKRQGALLWRYQSESTRFYLSPAGDVAEIAVTLFVLGKKRAATKGNHFQVVNI